VISTVILYKTRLHGRNNNDVIGLIIDNIAIRIVKIQRCANGNNVYYSPYSKDPESIKTKIQIKPSWATCLRLLTTGERPPN